MGRTLLTLPFGNFCVINIRANIIVSFNYLYMFYSWLKGLSYIHKIKKKKETNIWSIKVMDQLLNLEGTQICDYDRAGWNPLYCQRTMANYNTDSEEENKPEQDEETGLPNYDDLSATDAGVLGKNHGKQGKEMKVYRQRKEAPRRVISLSNKACRSGKKIEIKTKFMSQFEYAYMQSLVAPC